MKSRLSCPINTQRAPRWALKNAKEWGAAQPTMLPVPKPGKIGGAEFARWKEVLEGGNKALQEMVEVGSKMSP